MNLRDQYKQVVSMDWRPKFGRAKHPKRDMMKSWKAFGNKDNHNPVFEVGVHRGDVFSDPPYWPRIEATKYHAGNIGSVWMLDLESVDKLIIMLLAAREMLLKTPKNGPLTLAEAEAKHSDREFAPAEFSSKVLDAFDELDRKPKRKRKRE